MANYYAQNDYGDENNYDEDEETKADTIAQYLADQGGSVGSGEETDIHPPDESIQDVQPVVAPQAAPVPSVLPTASPNESAKEQAIRDHIQQQYAAANDGAGITQAKERAQRSNNIANFADAFESLAKSNSMAHGGSGVDTGFYQGIKQQGQQGIQQAVDERQAKVNEFLKQNAIQRQVAQDAIAHGTAEQQQKAAKYINDRNDPQSQVSQNSVNTARATFRDFANIDQVIKPGMSAVEVGEAVKGLEAKTKVDTSKTLKDAVISHQNQAQADRKNQLALTSFTNASEIAEGKKAPHYIQVAFDGISNGQKAQDIIDQYPNYNDMPSEQVSILTAEMAKIAQGGLASDHATAQQESKSFISDYEKFMSKVDNKPTGAQLGEFIKQKKTYLDNMMSTNQETINKFQRGIFNAHAPSFTPELTARFKQNYPEAFQEKKQAKVEQQQPPVHMIGKNGKSYTVPFASVEQAKAQGWKLPNLQAQGTQNGLQ